MKQILNVWCFTALDDIRDSAFVYLIWFLLWFAVKPNSLLLLVKNHLFHVMHGSTLIPRQTLYRQTFPRHPYTDRTLYRQDDFYQFRITFVTCNFLWLVFLQPLKYLFENTHRSSIENKIVTFIYIIIIK